MADYAGFRNFRTQTPDRSADWRSIGRLLILVGMTIPLILTQLVVMHLAPRRWNALPAWWHRQAARVFGVNIRIVGQQAQGRPVLYTSNHLSWLDIVVLGGRVPGSFIAKREVEGWGIFGFLSKCHRTVFVNRDRRATVLDQRRAMRERFEAGDNLLLFPEGTSTDGKRVERFKSSLFDAAFMREDHESPIWVQPVTICYTRFNGVPCCRVHRPLVAWFGDMELANHVWQLLRYGRIEAVIQFHEPIDPEQIADRKALSALAHDRVAEGLLRAHRGEFAALGSGNRVLERLPQPEMRWWPEWVDTTAH